MRTSRPSLFPTRRLKHVVTLRRSRVADGDGERPYVGLEAIESWTGKLIGQPKIADENLQAHANSTSLNSLFETGDVLLGKLRPYLAKAWAAEFPGRCTTELLVMRPMEVLPQFLCYVCVSFDFIAAVDASTFGSRMPRANWNVIGNLPVPVPDHCRQYAVVAYLNRETTRLDSLLSENVRVLKLLVERRRALITRVVTRGLNSDAPFRDSGVPWLGKIPAHWETARSKWLFRERDQRTTTGEEDLLTVSHLTGVTPRSQKNVNMFEASTKEGYKICLSGDLVVNTMWAWMGAMGVTQMDGIVSPSYNVYEPRARLDPGYVAALTRLPVFAQEVTRHSKGVWSSRLRLYPQGFFAISLPVPPLTEQREIAAHIESRTSILDELHAATQATTALLSERRAALIAAAVSGHIDVEGDP